MKKCYLIRHALPDFPDGRGMCIGTTDIPLGETGFMQAEHMAQLLPSVSAVYSSPLTRSIQTARPIGLPIIILDDLREMYAGEWDGLTFEQIRIRYPELYEARQYDLTLPLPGAEDHLLAQKRFMSAMETAALQAPGDFAVVAHGGIIAQFLQQISGVWRKPDYVEIVPLLWDGTRFSLT